MKATGECPKCSSANVLADARVVDRGHMDFEKELSISTFGRPDVWIFKDRRATEVSAWVCGDCGFVELYVDAPASLDPQAPVRCLSCGETIADDADACGRCGWSWKSD